MRTSSASSVLLTRRFRTCLFVAALAASLALPPTAARAQDADPVPAESDVGYELALHGITAGERGASVQLAGIAYEVHGLAELRPMAGLTIAAAITSSVPRGTGHARERVAEARARSAEGGRFALEIAIPARDLASPMLEIVVQRASGPGRTFRFGLAQLASRSLALLTDRNRYQPGETVRAWSLLRSTRGRAPIAGAPITFSLVDEGGAPIAERAVETGASGAATVEIVIPESASAGSWTVRVTSAEPGTIEAARSIDVVRRTVERLAVSVTLERELIEPGGALRGTVEVKTPSGTPVRGARVLVSVGDDDAPPLELVTDDDGLARIDAQAPSFLAGEVSVMHVVARVTSAAYGTLAASAPYTLARTRWLVAATPEAGGLVPEVESELFLSVADPRGRPIAAGTEIEARGIGLRGGRVTATTDAHGIAAIRVRLPRG
ncbi:MAG: MG2 domain-containing protein, partial [Myxococcota bacterium]|nr:MG2 domain-containing protein [Myxococcota bacterium]